MAIPSGPVENAPRIDAREREMILKFIKDYQIELHDRILIQQLRAINFERPTTLDLQLWALAKAQVARYAAFHEQYPFPIAPSPMLQGPYTLAVQKANYTAVQVSPQILARHTLITSQSGGGKTTFAHHLIAQLITAGIKLLAIDAKDDSKYLVVRNPDCIVLHPRAPFNLMQIPPYLTSEEFIATFITCFTRAYYSAELAKQILNEAMRTVLSGTAAPSLFSLHKAVLKMYCKTDTYSRRDAITGVALRLQRINYHYPGLFHTTHGISLEELFRHSVYLPVTLMDESAEFLTSYLAHQLYLHNRAKGIRDGLTHIIYLDEGLLSYSKNNTSITGAPQLSFLQSLVREFSIGMIVTTTSITQTDPVLKSNTGLQVCMTLMNSKESEEISKTFNLNPGQKEYLDKHLLLGECIIRMSGTWKEPILGTFLPLAYPKTVADNEWEEAKQRINAFVPPEPVAQPLQLGLESMDTPLPSPELEKTEEPQEPKKPKSPSKVRAKEPVLALSEQEKALLQSVCQGLDATNKHYEALAMHPMAGTKAKKKLIALGLIQEEAIVARPGRGGRAKVLFPTENGFLNLGLKPIRGTRGGDSPQHRYLCRAMADLIPEANLELLVRDKSIDVFFRYKDALHRALWDALRIIFNMENKASQSKSHLRSVEQQPQAEPGIIFNMESNVSPPTQVSPQHQPPDINAGQAPEPGIIFNMENNASKAGVPFQPATEDAPIGLEVECSDVAKTTPENVRKNFEVGVSLQIFAIMPDQLARAKALLKDVSNVYVIDALQLLQTLREVYASKDAS